MFRKEFDAFSEADTITTVVSYLAPYNLSASHFELIEAAKLLIQANTDQTYRDSLAYLIQAEQYCPNIGPLGHALKAQLYFDLQESSAFMHDKAPSLSIADFRGQASFLTELFLNLANKKLTAKNYKHAQHYLTQAMAIELAVNDYPENYDGNRFLTCLTQIQHGLRQPLEILRLEPEILASLATLNQLNQINPQDASYYFSLCQLLDQKISAVDLYQYGCTAAWLQATKLDRSSGVLHLESDANQYLTYNAKCFSDLLCEKYKITIAQDKNSVETLFQHFHFHADFSFTTFQALMAADLAIQHSESNTSHDVHLHIHAKRCQKLTEGLQTAEQFAQYTKFMPTLTVLSPVYALIAAQTFALKRNFALAKINFK